MPERNSSAEALEHVLKSSERDAQLSINLNK